MKKHPHSMTRQKEDSNCDSSSLIPHPSSLFRGFSLVEVMVVLTVIGVLIALSVPSYQRAVEQARADVAVANLRAIWSAERLFWIEHHPYTADLSALRHRAARSRDRSVQHGLHLFGRSAGRRHVLGRRDPDGKLAVDRPIHDRRDGVDFRRNLRRVSPRSSPVSCEKNHEGTKERKHEERRGIVTTTWTDSHCLRVFVLSSFRDSFPSRPVACTGRRVRGFSLLELEVALCSSGSDSSACVRWSSCTRGSWSR